MQEHIIIKGKHEKPILIDLHFCINNKSKPIIIFCHGYKGFKDWGAWNIMSEYFVNEGYYFVKFNFSFNGGTLEQPIDFPDLEAFGNNNYTKELDDLESVIDFIYTDTKVQHHGNINNISLLGHSRGGGIVSIKAEEDNRIKNVISLAGVSDYKIRFPKDNALENWRKTKVYYVQNGRTKQSMPHYYQFYSDFISNESRLTISRAVKQLKIPHLIIHGDKDTSVSIEEAYLLKKWNSKSILTIIKEANHVFGASHPWNTNNLPNHLKQAVIEIINFLTKPISRY